MLSKEQELHKHELRIEQMTVNVEKMRADMQGERLRVTVPATGIVVAAFAAGAAWMHYSHP